MLATLLLLAQVHPVAQIDTTVEDGIRRGAYPGAVAIVGTADTVLLARGYGRLTWRPDDMRPSPDTTLWDLASLTKVIATTTAIMVLVDRGAVDLDAPVAEYLGDFAGEGKAAVTVRDLLAHTSGLRAFLPLNTLTETAEEARARVMSEPLRWAPGRRVVYSDLNAMLLGWIVEAVSGRGLDVFTHDEVFAPLGMSDTRYGVARADRERTAPINRWRGTPIRGVVHDQNAERLGGVSGHAGLYSTGSDLVRLAQFILRGGTTADGRQLVRSEVVREFLEPGRDHRALGWEVHDTTTTTSSAGTRLSGRAVGHGGYTGTSIWIDPERGLFVILLTNRVYAPRTGRSISELRGVRGRLADAAVALQERSCRMRALAGAGSC